MDGDQLKEWAAAQGAPISVDLVAAAKQELELLAEVDRHPSLYGGPVVLRAIERYEKFWLPLLANEGSSSKELLQLIPPLDCGWIWHCHRLNPVRYAKDCEDLYGRILDAPLINPGNKDVAIRATMERWLSRYSDEPYNVDVDTPPFENGNPKLVQTNEASENGAAVDSETQQIKSRRITYDLADAVSRQKTFYFQVSQPFVSQENFLRSAEQRYKGFLHLFTVSKGLFLVPTYDVDIMWHAHQRSPVAYKSDCLAILNRVLDHDDTDSDRSVGQKLQTGFKDTCELWELTFGTIYVKAGAMYRGDQPAPVPPPLLRNAEPVKETSLFSVEQQQQDAYLTRRQTVQVCLVLLGARYVPTNSAGPTLFVRIKVLRNCGSFQLDTYEVPTSSDPLWRQILTLTFETSTEGLVLQLRSRTTGMFTHGSKLLGEVNLTWEMLLASPSLSLKSWLPLCRRNFSGLLASGQKSTALNVSASITPPITAPYLFRMIESHVETGDQHLHRTVFNQANKISFTIHIQYGQKNSEPQGALGNVNQVSIYQVSQKQSKGSKTKQDTGRVTGRARLLVHPQIKEQTVSSSMQWTLFDDNVQLIIQRNSEDSQWHFRPELNIQGQVGNPVKLVSGRKLDYQVNGAIPEEEAGFVTLIRYMPGAPLGKATAVFNTRSGAMEVKPEENVSFVILLSTVISLSIMDMLGGSYAQPQKRGNLKIKGPPRGYEWGSVILEKQPNEKSDMARRMAFYNLLNYQYWWDMPFVLWCASFYSNPSLLGDETAYQHPGLLADGKSRSGRSRSSKTILL